MMSEVELRKLRLKIVVAMIDEDPILASQVRAHLD